MRPRPGGPEVPRLEGVGAGDRSGGMVTLNLPSRVVRQTHENINFLQLRWRAIKITFALCKLTLTVVCNCSEKESELKHHVAKKRFRS